MALKHAKTSGLGAPADPAKVGGSDWDADHVIDAGGFNVVGSTTAPAAPGAGSVQLWSKLVAGVPLPAWTTPGGQLGVVQNSLAHKRAAWVMPLPNATGFSGMGIQMQLGAGSLTARSLASSSALAALRRLGFVSAASAGSTASFIHAGFAGFVWRGNAANQGGFRVVLRWACSDAATVAGARSFAGLHLASLGNVDPSSQLNCIGVGTDAGDSTLYLMHNDGAGTATKVALGASFPDHTLSADAYELVLFCAPNASSINVEVTRLFTGDMFRATVTTNLPDATAFVQPLLWRNNGATALAVGVDMIGLYVEAEQ